MEPRAHMDAQSEVVEFLGSPAAYPEPSREGLWVHLDSAGAATVLASPGRAAAALVAAVAPAGAIGPASPGTTPGGEDGR